MRFNWNAFSQLKLKTMWEQGYQIDEIAARIGTTSASIKNKAVSMGLPKDRPELVIVTMKNLRDGLCRWPVGTPGTSEFHFCGERTETGQTYCCKHRSVAFKAA